MKLAVSGKGGVGKTTLSGMLIASAALAGRSVIALDADPDANLGSALGLPPGGAITPLSEMHQLIEERTGASKGYGGYFKLNPRVDDIPETYACRIGKIRLLVLGGVKAGGDGCICPASALLKALLTHLVLGRDDHLIMDMEAGIEHLGRATAQSMDALIVVVDPGPWSIQTAHRVRNLAADIQLTKVVAVANRLTHDGQLAEIEKQLGDIPLIGHLPADDRLMEGFVNRTADGSIAPRKVLQDLRPSLEGIYRELEARI